MPGQINWVELPAADTAKARTFYGGLFDWRTSEFGGDYHVIDNGPAGAIAPARTISPTCGSTSPPRTSTPR
jgi:predicted enzyme related to lactoylglutathione lyase